jgi:Kef-type K+ transport system membrane component KefB/nucleotide-binding universal stress UspA family protein
LRLIETGHMNISATSSTLRRLFKSRSFWLVAALSFVLAAGAFAADGKSSGEAKPSEVLFVIQLTVLIFAGRLLGELMQRIGQPSVMGQLLSGLILGPSVLGFFWPDFQHALFPKDAAQKAMLDGIAQFGVLMLLLLAGMETDLRLVRRIGKAAFTVSLTGIALPFVCGFFAGQFIPDSLLPNPTQRTVAALFLGTALSISSVKIVAMVVREMNFMRRNVGQVILASAIIDDTVGWIIIAITFSLVESGTIDFASLGRSVVGTLAFIFVSLTLGRRVVFWLIRWTNDNFVSEVPVISTILVILGCMALITDAIGVKDVLGAFIAGVLVGESPILSRRIDLQLRGLITGLFAPVFFGTAGLAADLTVLGDSRIFLLTCGLILIASIGKFSGAFAGGLIGRLTTRESLALGCGMNARGSTEVIVATIGLSSGVLSQDFFSMIVTMALITTMAMPPMLRWSLARLPLGSDEKARLEREESEAKGFLPRMERLLLTVDDSANAKFAARLTGMIAGGRGRPTTVLHIEGEKPQRTASEVKADRYDTPEQAVKAGAESTTHVADSDVPKPKPARVDIISHNGKTEPQAAVAAEARKGYDLMIVGIADTAATDDSLGYDLARIVAAFDGPLIVSVGYGGHLEHPGDSPLNILVPVNGSDASRRAIEVATALARASHAQITALYVTNPDSKGISGTRRHEEAILKDAVEFAERYDVHPRTRLRAIGKPSEAILHEIAIGRHNLVVMGVDRRPGDRLFFGDTASNTLRDANASILFVTGGVRSDKDE